MPEIISFQTKNLQILLCLCLVISGFLKHNRTFPCGNSLFRDKILTHYHHYTMSTWGQSERAISAWIQRIMTKRIHSPVRPPFFTIHHPPTLEDPTCPTKKSCSSKNYTQLNYLPSDPLHKIGMWQAGLVHNNKLKPVLARFAKKNPVLRSSKYYKLKDYPFDYFMLYDVIKYMWADRGIFPQKSNCDNKWVK